MSNDTLMGDKISIIEHDSLKFIIMDCPTDANLQLYLKVLKHHNVKNLVRVCEPTYSSKLLNDNGISVYEMAFNDGQSPPRDILRQWLELVDAMELVNTVGEEKEKEHQHQTHEHEHEHEHEKEKLKKEKSRLSVVNGEKRESRESSISRNSSKTNLKNLAKEAIAVHCVAGLGRAPVLVASALLERGIKALDAVELIRKKRRGALNNKQILYLEAYKPLRDRSISSSLSKSFSKFFRRSPEKVQS